MIKDGSSATGLALDSAPTMGLILTGANTYSGATTIWAGTLKAGAANTFSAASATTVNGTLDLGGYNETVSSLSGGGVVTNGGSSAATLTNQGASSTFSGVIQDGTGTTGLTQDSTTGGTLTLTGRNTYTGVTTVQAGTLKGGAAGAFSAASATTVAGALDLGGYNQTVSSLSGGGTVTNSGSGAATLTNQGASSIFSGVIEDGTGATGLSQGLATAEPSRSPGPTPTPA